MLPLPSRRLALLVGCASSWSVTVSPPARANEGTGAEEKGVEVEVRAAPLSPAASRKDASVAGSTLEREELEAPGLGAADALRTSVGVTVTETGGLGAAATASVRGATAAQTPVYLAGVRINDDVGGGADLSTLPLWLVERIEVYRGNAPFEADRLGIGGAIFFEPVRPTDSRAVAGAMLGSWSSRGAWAYAAKAGAAGSLLVGARLDGAANDYAFPSDNGTAAVWRDDRSARLQNADTTLSDLWLLGRVHVPGGRFDLVANRFEREQGAPRLALVPTHAARQSLSRTLASLAGRAELGGAGTLELRTTLLAANTAVDDPAGELGLAAAGGGSVSARLEQRGERIEQHVAVRVAAGPRTALRAAVETSSEALRRYEGIERANAAPVLSARRATFRAAASAELSLLDELWLRPLAALECRAEATDGSGGCKELEPVGRAGALFRAGGLTAFGAVGRYVRFPTLGELYGTSLAVRGNPQLASETGTTFDLGVRLMHRLAPDSRPLYAAASGYIRTASELVSFVHTEQDYVTPVNLGTAVLRGLELEAGSGFGRYLHAEIALTFFDGRDTTPGRRLSNDVLPYQPRLVAAPALRVTTPRSPGAWLSRAELGARWVYQSNRFAAPAGLDVIPAQHFLDLDAAAEAAGGALCLRGRVADVFDTPRWDVVGFPLPGRSVFVSLELRGE